VIRAVVALPHNHHSSISIELLRVEKKREEDPITDNKLNIKYSALLSRRISKPITEFKLRLL